MELNEKLQELRKQKGLTQEELASALYVSRTAVSKWESGRGYPSIDSLKALAAYFGVTVDALLSGEELLSVAGEDVRQKEASIRAAAFGWMDISTGLLFFLPLFGQPEGTFVRAVGLISLSGGNPWLKGMYMAAVVLMIGVGLCTLLRRSGTAASLEKRQNVSMAVNVLAALMFIAGRHPYAAVLVFVFLLMKGMMRIKKP